MIERAAAPRFTPRARRELRDAAAWIAEDNPSTAVVLLKTGLKAAILLQANPQLGRVRPELAPEPYRFWPLRGFPYVLVYNAETNPLVIVRVVHQSRDLPEALSELL